MRIEKLEIKGFGKFNQFTLELREGLNIISGANESGKTTVQTFIKGMLFGLKGGRSAKDGELSPSKKYRPWNGGDYHGFIQYRLDNGGLYRVGRNFGTNAVRVFDGLFNDITGTFEVSREKGVQFAEKHLGMNEACFERTVFIKQMDSRVDGSGGRELLGRLANVSQTGFEDVSFRAAENALREALKNYVGTDKTTTRPLDKINARLEELKQLKASLIGKKASLFSVEEELYTAATAKDRLEAAKAAAVRARELVGLRSSVEADERRKAELSEILVSVKKKEEELMTASRKLKELNETRERYRLFSAFDGEDAEALSLEYSRMSGLAELLERLQSEADRKKRELEGLEKEAPQSDINVLNEKIKVLQGKRRMLGIGAAAFAGLSALSFAAGFAGITYGPAAGLVMLAAAAVLALVRVRASKELSGLATEKRMSFVSANMVAEEIRRKRTDLNMELERLENEMGSLSRQISAIKGPVLEKLAAAGVLEAGESRVGEEHVKSFRQGVSAFTGTEPEMGYMAQRMEDMEKDLRGLYAKASSVCGSNCKDREGVAAAMEEIQRNTGRSREATEALIKEIEGIYVNGGFSSEEFADLKARVLAEDAGIAANLVEDAYNQACEGLSNVLLRMKENETLLKSLAGDGDELQRIEEELAELEGKKYELEEAGASLKIALDVLTEACAEVQRDFVPVLNDGMSRIIGRISGGRYRDLRADDNLCLKAIVPETGDVVQASGLSGGTVDQVYLALRISMADLIAGTGEKLPLLMDEVFAQYDDDRTRQGLEFFRELSRERQVVLFTCKGREADLAREICGNGLNVIEL